ncbi:hypothetical protein M472_04060 [Sphingobacterium paucimobilis HER1398]|uniref:Uncharacterized protein n=1 Tax=Sphingobacterium paucimobilis HER1398 TaxID=1346330 RepID=U2IZ06_9SPHI|nr:hypothetical protein M472_04060 [Sphingobacterium paucimobilis HER1398]
MPITKVNLDYQYSKLKNKIQKKKLFTAFESYLKLKFAYGAS